MKEAKLKNYSIFVALFLISVFICFNIYWIHNYADDFISEDMILISQATRMIPLLDDINSIYYFNSQPLFPYFLANLMSISADEFMPFYLENFFFAISGVLIFLIIQKLYNGKLGIYALLIFLLLPGTIQYSRTIYAIGMLTFFFLLSIYSYINSDNFRNLGWALVWSVSCVLMLMTKYMMIPYVLAEIFIWLFFFIFNLFTHFAQKKKAEKTEFKRRFLNFIIALLIVWLLAVPHYRHERNLALFSERSVNNHVDFSNPAFILCNMINYPLLMSQSQLGFLPFLLFFISVIILFINLFKKIYLLEELFMLAVLMQVMFFFSFISPIKNSAVTGPLVPLALILIFSMVSRMSKKARQLVLSLLIINGILVISPYNPFAGSHVFEGWNNFKDSLNCGQHITACFVGTDQAIVTRDSELNHKPNSFFYITPERTIKKMAKEKLAGKKEIRIADMTNIGHFELNYYALTEANMSKLGYFRCEDFLEDPYKANYSFDFLIVRKNFSYARTFTECEGCWSVEKFQYCDMVLQELTAKFEFDSQYGELQVFTPKK